MQQWQQSERGGRGHAAREGASVQFSECEVIWGSGVSLAELSPARASGRCPLTTCTSAAWPRIASVKLWAFCELWAVSPVRGQSDKMGGQLQRQHHTADVKLGKVHLFASTEVLHSATPAQLWVLLAVEWTECENWLSSVWIGWEKSAINAVWKRTILRLDSFDGVSEGWWHRYSQKQYFLWPFKCPNSCYSVATGVSRSKSHFINLMRRKFTECFDAMGL